MSIIQAKFVSSPANWADYERRMAAVSDDELERRATSPDGGVYAEEYIAGDHGQWNGSRDSNGRFVAFREPGDVYTAVCREQALLGLRRDRRERGEPEPYSPRMRARMYDAMRKAIEAVRAWTPNDPVS